MNEMTYLFSALMMVVLGGLIRYKQWSWMIAGYNTSSQKVKDRYDEVALCNGTGNFLFVLAGILLLNFLGEITGNHLLITAGWSIFAIATVFFLVYVNTSDRFKKTYDKVREITNNGSCAERTSE